MSINVRWVTTDSVDFSGGILFQYHFPATEIASQVKIPDDGSARLWVFWEVCFTAMMRSRHKNRVRAVSDGVVSSIVIEERTV